MKRGCLERNQFWFDFQVNIHSYFLILYTVSTVKLKEWKSEFLSEAKRGNFEKLKIIHKKATFETFVNIAKEVINIRDEYGQVALLWSIKRGEKTLILKQCKNVVMD